ncbi:hypothetical protein [Staphylococcus auricularis]|uniref:Uncharacterized protein n=1 Tax=Staphylococcus auricularis TaxID=29379 RepID=A0ABX5IHA2_9STAP|nr:hypothetical protein [Staphylococcus auricularis]MCE5039204.1 hypothetical protein [Staphylococcus auricularis]MEB6570372.1 hypothetical protein [Staphylococcus auricularis]PTH19024.1 hypothetical protein BU607_02970 [Staphylococcus auricularis]PTH26341.1 hypothetical protein BU608_04720 [Staphylococcus auricularis]
MFEKPKVAMKPIFNYMLIIVGILAFLLFFFVIDVNALISLIMFLVPTIVAVVNLKQIKNSR